MALPAAHLRDGDAGPPSDPGPHQSRSQPAQDRAGAAGPCFDPDHRDLSALRLTARARSERKPRLSLWRADPRRWLRSEEHTSELQSLMRISYTDFCLKKKLLIWNK